MSELPIIEVRDLGKRYEIGRSAAKPRLFAPKRDDDQKKYVWALRNLSFSIRRGERVAVIGSNGAGKSTLLKILSRVAYPTEGEARIRGRLTALLEVGSGFSDILTGRENIFLNASLYGLGPEQVKERLNDIIAFAELERFIDTPIRYYSTGMRARLGFAVAAHLDPDILLLDEVLAVGDMAFQRKCLERMQDLTGVGRTLLFVSHSMQSVRHFCDRAIWLDRGQVLMDDRVEVVTQAYTDQVLSLRAEAKWELAPRTVAAAKTESPEALDMESKARMLAARIVGEDGAPTAHVFASSPFSIEVEYELLQDDVVVLPAFRVYGDTNQLLFTVVHHEPGSENWRRKAGVYRSRVRAPAHLLNTGRHSVSIGLNTPGGERLIRHHIEENALTFTVHESRRGDPSARGPYREVKGAVRPLLVWETDKIDNTTGGPATVRAAE